MLINYMKLTNATHILIYFFQIMVTKINDLLKPDQSESFYKHFYYILYNGYPPQNSKRVWKELFLNIVVRLYGCRNGQDDTPKWSTIKINSQKELKKNIYFIKWYMTYPPPLLSSRIQRYELKCLPAEVISKHLIWDWTVCGSE